MKTALTLLQNFDLMWADVQGAEDFQTHQDLKLKVRGECTGLLEYAFAVFGGLVCPFPKELTVDARKQQIAEDVLRLCEESVKGIYSLDRSLDGGGNCKMSMLSCKLHHLMWERDRLEGQDASAGERARLEVLHLSMGFHDFFSGNKRKIGVNAMHWLRGAELALAFSRQGHAFWLNGCQIRFNDLWQEYILYHPEIGTIGGYKEFEHARDDAKGF